MEKYSNNIYYGLVCQGKAKEAAEYLKRFTLTKRRAKRCYDIFENGKMPKTTGVKAVDDILNVFAEYYRMIFWRGESAEAGLRYLCERFASLYALTLPDMTDDSAVHGFWDDIIEKRLEDEVVCSGYHYLGGDTQGYLGPYIWKKTKSRTYRVELPDTIQPFELYFTYGFVSRSWMSFISLGKIGTGGWAGGDGKMYCVYKSYWKRLLTSAFKVNFLKHEAQHLVDKKNYPEMSSMHLEYRAKLVQLIYAKSMGAFSGFLSEASDADKSNSHAYASYLLIRNLSRSIFNKECESDIKLWKKKRSEIAACALELFREYPKNMS